MNWCYQRCGYDVFTVDKSDKNLFADLDRSVPCVLLRVSTDLRWYRVCTAVDRMSVGRSLSELWVKMKYRRESSISPCHKVFIRGAVLALVKLCYRHKTKIN